MTMIWSERRIGGIARMKLRFDVAAAAERMTGGLEVGPEIRKLNACLREGEIVERMAGGVYRAGAGLMAVTSQRVLLLREGQDSQASVGFPLERLSSVDWARGAERGTISIRDTCTVAELADVALTDGESIVQHLRSRVVDRTAHAGRNRVMFDYGAATRSIGKRAPVDSAAPVTVDTAAPPCAGAPEVAVASAKSAPAPMSAPGPVSPVPEGPAARNPAAVREVGTVPEVGTGREAGPVRAAAARGQVAAQGQAHPGPPETASRWVSAPLSDVSRHRTPSPEEVAASAASRRQALDANAAQMMSAARMMSAMPTLPAIPVVPEMFSMPDGQPIPEMPQVVGVAGAGSAMRT